MIGNTLDLENKKEKGNTNTTFLPSLEDGLQCHLRRQERMEDNHLGERIMSLFGSYCVGQAARYLNRDEPKTLQGI